jgi:methylmalonyl-CoA carboxyltransferase 12S subunit
MKTETVDWPHVVDTLGQLREELAKLQDRIARLEAGGAAAPGAEAAPLQAAAAAPPPAAPPETISEEVLLAISAAIAAFLGKRAHIRQIRLVGSGAWAQQGRAFIQASHAIQVHHA